jgi:N-succinyldiaminopimelate aminotransferase
VNPLLKELNPYPFERLRGLLTSISANSALAPINLSIGEPKHPTPLVLADAVKNNLAGLSVYPATAGTPALRQAISTWLQKRYALNAIDPIAHVLPVNGSREALFALTQVIVDPQSKKLSGQKPIVIAPNPFYQIYEGATILAGAQAYYVNQAPEADFECNWQAIPTAIWERCQMVFVCSPGNPTGRVMPLAEWQNLFELSDRYGFVIASDECYSEIWHSNPPLGGLQAAEQLGRDFTRLISFTSLSKRSNVPGLRSGFVAGDPDIIKAFLLYRTYHGSAMSPVVQAASLAAWNDETHVQENRALYAAKFKRMIEILKPALPVQMPDAGFYLWVKVTGADDVFVRELYQQQNVLTLPGSYLSRATDAGNPGAGFVRLALVESLHDCEQGALRILKFINPS